MDTTRHTYTYIETFADSRQKISTLMLSLYFILVVRYDYIGNLTERQQLKLFWHQTGSPLSDDRSMSVLYMEINQRQKNKNLYNSFQLHKLGKITIRDTIYIYVYILTSIMISF